MTPDGFRRSMMVNHLSHVLITLGLNTWILSKFSTLYWICLLFIFLVLESVELPLCTVGTLSWNVYSYTRVKTDPPNVFPPLLLIGTSFGNKTLADVTLIMARWGGGGGGVQ